MSAVSLGTMPVTQRIWTWDRFLHGGHDFELCALMALIFLSLVLVLSKHCRRCIELLFAQSRLRGFNLTDARAMAIPPHWAGSVLGLNTAACTISRIDSIPLQI